MLVFQSPGEFASWLVAHQREEEFLAESSRTDRLDSQHRGKASVYRNLADLITEGSIAFKGWKDA